MTWFKVDDGFAAHPKVLGIPRVRRHSAVGLWTLSGSWCARNLTDGAVPAYMLDELGAADDAVKDLVSSRLWEETADGYQFHDYLDYNPSREKVLAERESAAERQRQARERSAAKRRAAQDAADGASQRESQRDAPSEPGDTGAMQGELDGIDGPSGDASQRDSRRMSQGKSQGQSRPPRPDPTRPDPTRKNKKPRGAADAGVVERADPQSRIADAVYEHTEKMAEWIAIQQIAKRALNVSGATEESVLQAMTDLWDAGKPIILTTVGQVLSGSLDPKGGKAEANPKSMTEAQLRMHALNPHLNGR